MKRIAENVHVAWIILTALAGAYGYVIKVDASASQNAKDIVEMKEQKRSSDPVIAQIATDIAVIKVKLEVIEQRLPRQAGITHRGE